MVAHELSDLTLTTGNSFTATATLGSIESLFAERSARCSAAVIGARGSVGRVIALGLAHRFGELVLLGRPGTEETLLRDVLPELMRLAVTTEQPVTPGSVLARFTSQLGADPKEFLRDPSRFGELAADMITSGAHIALGLRAEGRPETVLPLMDCVVSVTSEGKPFLKSSLLRPGAVAFDTARPFDFIRGENCVAQVYDGGLVHQPEAVLYTDRNMIDAPAGVNLACLSETIVLALDRGEGHHSIGKFIPLDSAVRIAETARRHGFRPMTYST